MQLRLRVPKGAAWYARSAPLLMEARLTPAAIEAAAARMNLYMLACILEAVTRVGSPVDAVDNHGNTPLHCAVWGQMTQRSSSLAKAQCLLAAGCSPYAENAHGSTPLHFACQAADAMLVRELLRAGADVTAISKQRPRLGGVDIDPLMSMLQMLLAAGVELTVQPDPEDF
jgi:ankyrin repeat protein